MRKHAVASQHPLRIRILLAAATVALLAAGAAAYSVLGLGVGGSYTPPASSRPVAAPTTSATGQDAVWVAIDGWSLKTVGPDGITLPDAAPVMWRPAGADDVTGLLRDAPGAVAVMVARLITDDPTLTCDRGGCSTKAGAVDLVGLTDAAAIPALGTSYQAYGIDSGMYVARIAAPGGSVTLSGPGGSSVRLSAGRLPGKAAVVDGGGELAPNAANGFLAGRFVIAAGLGRLFTPDAAWVGSDLSNPVQFRSINTGPPATGAADKLADSGIRMVAARGLGEMLPTAAGWSNSHLTFATSPTTGCGQEALCVPGLADAAVSGRALQTEGVCAPGGQRAVLAVENVTVRVRLAGPTHQFGVTDGDQLWSGQPKLTSGVRDIAFTAAVLFTGDPLSPWLAGGRVSDDVDAGPTSMAAVLANVQLGGWRWSPCQ